MIDNRKWSQFSLTQQLGHVASEISRAKHWEEKGDAASRDKALERALELIDLTLLDRRWAKRLKEIVRLREVICDWFSQQENYDVSRLSIDEYCATFALYGR